MSVDTDKICRTCLALNGPLLSIYDNSSSGDFCLAVMLGNFTKMKFKQTDKMPEKVCLSCISEINRCYSFKMKCENSNRTLRQLIPDAEIDDEEITNENGSFKPVASKAVQTMQEIKTPKKSVHVQTMPEENKKENETQILGTKPLPLVNLLEEIPKQEEITYSGFKRRAGNESLLKISKRKHTENYEIDCDEYGNEIILEINNSTLAQTMKDNKHLMSGKSLTLTKKPKLEETNTSLYQINQNFDCGELEVEAVVHDDDHHEEESSEIIYIETEPNNKKLQDQLLILQDIGRTENELVMKQSKKVNNKKSYPCTECEMTFFSYKVLRRHMLKKHEITIGEEPVDTAESPIKSIEDDIQGDVLDELCNDNLPLVAKFKKEDSVANHVEPKYSCDVCKAGFASIRSLNYHQKMNVCKTQINQCDHCERVFNSLEKLEAHKEEHQLTEYKCSECTNCFKSQEELSQHQIDAHKRDVRNQCNICKKVFTMLSTLKDHLRTHSGEKPFLCTICGKSFTQKSNLNQHLQRHNAAKKFDCDECPTSYVTKAELLSHKRTHTGAQPFKCEWCSATFTLSCSLIKHKRRHTGERPYACDICPMRFAVLGVLKNHRRLHTGEKPFKCTICDKRFIQKGDCVAHMRRHDDKKLFVCDCGSTFNKVQKLQKHAKEVHGEIGNNIPTEDQKFEANISDDNDNGAEDTREGVTDLLELSLAKICGQ